MAKKTVTLDLRNVNFGNLNNVTIAGMVVTDGITVTYEAPEPKPSKFILNSTIKADNTLLIIEEATKEGAMSAQLAMGRIMRVDEPTRLAIIMKTFYVVYERSERILYVSCNGKEMNLRNNTYMPDDERSKYVFSVNLESDLEHILNYHLSNNAGVRESLTAKMIEDWNKRDGS
jgi:hypothetical protein